MYASTNATPGSASAAVVGPQFILPYPLDLFFTTEAPGMMKGHLVALDLQGKLLFQVNTLKDQRIICDAAGDPLVTEREKFMTLHNRRQVFRGESNEKKDMLFIVKESSAFQFHKKLDVFLASNINGDVCDYKIVGKYKNRSCSVYKGESSFVVAQMSKEETHLTVGKKGFKVGVSPHTDYAFIAALIFIRHQIRKEEASEKEEAIDSAIEEAIQAIFG